MPRYDPSYGTEGQFFDTFNQTLMIISALSALLGFSIAVVFQRKITAGWVIIAIGVVAFVCSKGPASSGPDIGGALIFLVSEVLLLSGLSLVVRFCLIFLLK